MTAWEGFSAGFVAALFMLMLGRAALWIVHSRNAPDPHQEADGDWPADGRRG